MNSTCTRTWTVRALAAMAVVLTPSAWAFGVSVSPTAVFLDSQTQFGHVELSNTANETRVFQVEFDGPGTEGCVRVSPKMIMLPPGQSQTVRVQYKCPLESLSPQAMVFFMENSKPLAERVSSNQLDFRLRLGLKMKVQQSPLQNLF